MKKLNARFRPVVKQDEDIWTGKWDFTTYDEAHKVAKKKAEKLGKGTKFRVHDRQEKWEII